MAATSTTHRIAVAMCQFAAILNISFSGMKNEFRKFTDLFSIFIYLQ